MGGQAGEAPGKGRHVRVWVAWCQAVMGSIGVDTMPRVHDAGRGALSGPGVLHGQLTDSQKTCSASCIDGLERGESRSTS